MSAIDWKSTRAFGKNFTGKMYQVPERSVNSLKINVITYNVNSKKIEQWITHP